MKGKEGIERGPFSGHNGLSMLDAENYALIWIPALRGPSFGH